MKFAWVVSTICLALIAPTKGWILGPRLFGPTFDEYSATSHLLRKHREIMKDKFAYTFPQYEVKNSDKEIVMTMDIPGIKAEDIELAVQDQVLSISGHAELDREGYKYSSNFSQSFVLSPDVEIGKMSADLKDGVLAITAPKNLNFLEDGEALKIPVKDLSSTQQEIEESRKDSRATV